MKEKIVLITGGTRGLGRALSINYGKNGYYVYSTFSNDFNAADNLKREFKNFNIDGVCVQADVTKSDTSYDIDTKDEIIIINNACASLYPQPMHLLKWNDYELHINTSIKGSYILIQNLLKKLIKIKKVCIVNILSETIYEPIPKGFSHYITAKYALQGFTKSLSSELYHYGIKCFSISPGFMETSLTKNWPDLMKETIKNNQKKILSTEEISKKIFNITNDSSIPGRGEDYKINDI